ncbi:hypothetical protein L596_025169 [Steinernema carpocapsae]|uniref:ribose-5-phosphate isomerase n=1 Tax=Steinernema carpocapsae TaxID=34508 RepID=A0A4U5M709_STECR|nr:hypothetical protein L596_025169 [Steinernema carpocapsae]
MSSSTLLLHSLRRLDFVPKCRPFLLISRNMSGMSEIEKAKKHAAFQCASENVASGAKIGVGSGSTVKYFVQYLKENYAEKKLADIVCVPTSFQKVSDRKRNGRRKLPTLSPEGLKNVSQLRHFAFW